MFEKQFIQFIGECCAEVKRSPEYENSQKEMLAALDAIKAKLNDDDKKLTNILSDSISALEAAVEDDHFKAGFMAGVRLSHT